MLLKMTIELESDIVLGLINDSIESGFNTVEDFAAHLLEGYVLEIDPDDLDDLNNPDFSEGECTGNTCVVTLPVLPEDDED